MNPIAATRSLRLLALGGLLACLIPLEGRAQTYPSRPITMIVPAAPGGTTDFSARLLTEMLGSSLGQPFVIEIGRAHV